MQIFVLALSRLVPISFLVSLTLVGSRYLHDLVLRSHPRLSKWAFATVSLIGLLATAPYALRAGLIVAATWATAEARWQAADLLLTEYDSWNGRRTEELLRQWAFVRMSARNWAGAEEILRLAENPTPQARILLGICQYYREEPAAEATLRAVPDVTATQLCIRDYLLGRLAQKRGNVAEAFNLYARSAAWEPNFFPSIYHGVRLRMAQGNPAAAASILDAFTQQFPTQGTSPDALALRAMIRQRTVPPDKEFVIVSD
jgi:hypothetical protein